MNVFNFTHMGEVGQTKTNLAQSKYHWVLTVHRNALKRVRSVPPGTHCTRKRLETCSASTEEAVGPGPNGKLVPVKQLTVN